MEHIHSSCYQHDRPMPPEAENLAAEIRLAEELLFPHQLAPPCASEDVRCDCPPSVVIDP